MTTTEFGFGYYMLCCFLMNSSTIQTSDVYDDCI